MINTQVQRLFRVELTLGFITSLVLGCSSTDTTSAFEHVNLNPYTAVQLNVRAAVLSTIAPYDTLQLTATAYDANGNVIPLPGPVSYTTNDTTLKVSANGLVHMTNVPGTNANVIVSVQDTLENLTHTDTAFIGGTATVPGAPLVSFSIHPTGTDSAVLDLYNNATKTLTVTALDANGKVIPRTSLKIHFATANRTVAQIDATAGVIQPLGHQPGTVRLTASTTYYGVTKTDSLDFRIGYPDTSTEVMLAAALPGGSFNYYWQTNNMTVGVGKTVIFRIADYKYDQQWGLLAAGTGLLVLVGDRIINEGVQVVFDDPSVAQASPLPTSLLAAQFTSTGSGNVSLQVPDSLFAVDSIVTGNNDPGQYSVKLTHYCNVAPYPCATARSFSTPGTYNFHSTATGAAGTITVVQ